MTEVTVASYRGGGVRLRLELGGSCFDVLELRITCAVSIEVGAEAIEVLTDSMALSIFLRFSWCSLLVTRFATGNNHIATGSGVQSN